MKIRTVFVQAASCTAALLLASCTPSGLTTRGEGPAPDPLMGDWQGNQVGKDGVVRPAAVRVIALGGGIYRFNIQSAFDQRQDDRTVLADARLEGDNILPVSGSDWQLHLQNGELTGQTTRESAENCTLRRVVRLSPCLGARPPKAAVHLFDGTDLTGWERRDEKERAVPVAWKILDGGAMEVAAGSGDIMTKRHFTDFRLHVEFRLPFMPEAREQARANSGVYLQGRYEIQVLDSYGLKGGDNECGGIYKVAAPLVNMCAPPGQWQTYDITFHAAKYDAGGTKVQDAFVTVVHNGVVVQKDQAIPGPTGGALDDHMSQAGPILLQDHGNAVQYRNIWLVELR